MMAAAITMLLFLVGFVGAIWFCLIWFDEVFPERPSVSLVISAVACLAGFGSGLVYSYAHFAG